MIAVQVYALNEIITKMDFNVKTRSVLVKY